MLYERGYGRDQIIDLFRFIDWVITLPEELEEQFDQVLEEIEEERRVEYITSIERRGIRKGIEQGSLQTARSSLLQVLEVRFGSVPVSLREQIDRTESLERLQTLLSQAVLTDSLAAIQAALDDPSSSNSKFGMDSLRSVVAVQGSSTVNTTQRQDPRTLSTSAPPCSQESRALSLPCCCRTCL